MHQYARFNPATGRGPSYLLLHWATEIAKNMLESGTYNDRDAHEVLQIAFGTANALLASNGLRVAGTNKLTRTGRARERELLTRYTPDEVESEYEALTSAINLG